MGYHIIGAGAEREWRDGFGASIPNPTAAYSVAIVFKSLSDSGSTVSQAYPVIFFANADSTWAPDWFGYTTSSPAYTYQYFGFATQGWGTNSNLRLEPSSAHWPKVGRWEKYLVVRGGANGNSLWHRGEKISAADTAALLPGNAFNWTIVPNDAYTPDHIAGAQYAWNRALTDHEAKLESLNMRAHPLVRRGLWISMLFHGAQPVLLGADRNRKDGFTDTTISNAVIAEHPPLAVGRDLILPEYHWNASTSDWCEFLLDPKTDPNTDSGYILHVRRYKSGSATIKHVYAVVQGSTIIQEFEDPVVPAGETYISFPVTNASAITNHSDVRYRVRAIKVS